MTVFVGDILNATAATVTGIPTPTQSWQWLRSGTALPGFTGTSYRVLTGDAGSTLAVRETETNFMGAASATSDPTATVGTWTPSTLFALSEPGVWYDADDYTAMFQDTAGTTPITGAGQTVGLLLDKSKGLVLGPELVTNGTFTTDTAWTKGTNWTISGGVATYSGASTDFLSQNMGLVQGRTYQITLTSSATVNLRLGDTGASSNNTTGTQTILAVCTGTSGILSIRPPLGPVTIDNVSVKELPGNHATQSTLASRPTTVIRPMDAERRNLLTRTEEFENAAWTKTALTVSANVAVAPDGTATAEKVTVDTANSFHRLAAPTQNLSATSHTLSVYMKAAEYTSGGLSLFDGSVFTGRATFDLSAGTVAITNGTATITSVGNGWYRCTVTGNGSATTSAFISVNSVFTFTGDGTSGILIWGAQLEVGTTATPYQKVVTTNEWYDPAVPSYRGIQFDGVDDFLVSSTVDPTTGPTGPDLITNGNFSGGTTGWTAVRSTLSAGTGALAVTGTSNFPGVWQAFSTSAGKTYRVTFDIVSMGTSTTVRFAPKDGTGDTGTALAIVDFTTTGTKTAVFTAAGAASTAFFLAEQAATVNFTIDNISVRETAADKVQVFAGVRKLSDAASGILVELSATVANNGTFAFAVPNAPDDRYLFGSRGTTQTNASTQSSSYNAPTTSVLSGLGDIAGDSSTLRINGAQIARNTGEQGTGTYLAYPLYIGRRNGATIPFTGILTSLVVRFGANLSTSVINRAEYYVSDKTGVSL